LSETSTAKTAAITVLAASPMMGLAAFEDRLDDIGRQVGKPQNPADMGVVELELSGDLRRVAVFSAAKITNPRPVGFAKQASHDKIGPQTSNARRT
jgi:hypothetical protein